MIKQAIKTIGRLILIPMHIKKQLENFIILSIDYAQYNSIKNWNCISKNGEEIPWYTYPAIEYLENIDFSEKIIFEYGSGNSSLYWQNSAKEVISVEHDKLWFKKINNKGNRQTNQTILLRGNNESYENSIAEINKKFDVIIIDGIRRVECSKMIGNYLNYESTEGFMIILDNSDWYPEVAKYLRETLDLIEIDFHGFGPINNYTWTTSVLLSRNFNFKPKKGLQPYFSIGALKYVEKKDQVNIT